MSDGATARTTTTAAATEVPVGSCHPVVEDEEGEEKMELEREGEEE